MYTFEEIQSKDDEIFEIFRKNESRIIAIITKSNFKNTLFVLIKFIAKITPIKNSIYDLYKTNNIYAINILYRSLIEHFIKFLYIYFQLLDNKNDQIGVEYLELEPIVDKLAIANALKQYLTLFNEKEFSEAYDFDPKINKYLGKDIKEYKDKFKYRKIIDYIHKRCLEKSIYGGSENSFLLKLIPEYAELSSFVHGGHLAEEIMIKNTKEKTLESIALIKVLNTFHIHAMIMIFVFSIFSKSNERLENAKLEIIKIADIQ